MYALGLTLYELLTLRPAFSAATDSELLRLVVSAEPPKVRAINPAVPIDLETVVQKATAKGPADRYPSAVEFAADLVRFQAGLPVTARRLTRVQRAWRWARRHRRQLSAAGFAVGLGLILGLGLSTYFVWAAYREAEAGRKQLSAREDEFLTLVGQVNRSEFVLRDVPGAQAEQRELVRRVKEVLCRQADEPGASLRIRGEAYRACRRLVDVESRQGNQQAAAAAAWEARDRLAELTRDDPRTRESRLELARCSRDLGGVFVMAGDPDAALDQNRTALALYEELDAEEPGRTDVLNDLGHVRFAVAELLSLRGETGEAVAAGRRGLEVDEALARRFPTGHPQSYIRLSISHMNLAGLYCRAGDPVRAEEEFRKAVESEAVLVREFKHPDTLRLYTVASRGRLGMFLAGRGRFVEASRELTAGVADAERLAKLYPADAGNRVVLFDCYLELGRVAYLEGKTDEAREWFVKTADTHRGLAATGAQDRPAVMLTSIPVSGVIDPRTLLPPANAQAGLRHAEVQMRCGEYATAEAHFDEIIRAAGHDRAGVGTAGRHHRRGRGRYR